VEFYQLLLYVADVSTLCQSSGHGCTATGHGDLLGKDVQPQGNMREGGGGLLQNGAVKGNPGLRESVKLQVHNVSGKVKGCHRSMFDTSKKTIYYAQNMLSFHMFNLSLAAMLSDYLSLLRVLHKMGANIYCTCIHVHTSHKHSF
jgi:hypothetical protein